nr:hypothetical protein CFP56_10105 [Quercus suber]
MCVEDRRPANWCCRCSQGALAAQPCRFHDTMKAIASSGVYWNGAKTATSLQLLPISEMWPGCGYTTAAKVLVFHRLTYYSLGECEHELSQCGWPTKSSDMLCEKLS